MWGGGQQHLHCIKPKARLIVSFTSLMVALIRRRGSGGGGGGGKSDQVQLCVLISKRLHLFCTTLESDTARRFQGLRLFWVFFGSCGWFFFCFVSFYLFIYLCFFFVFFCLCAPSLASSTSGCHICFIEDPFGALLLPVARRAVNLCRGLHAETPRHT